MKILIAIGLALFTFIIVTMWACLRVASREDHWMETLSENKSHKETEDS